ncbi:MAG: hypothetical protein A2Y72_04760 [Chloroflexi bacterium RBG_13_53_26]|nr:MAG: hypothetical protein A2Y72_04760 [Chloroflexi bacterium RBG_13_53_26]
MKLVMYQYAERGYRLGAMTADELPDPGNLEVKLWVNDRELQRSNTRELVYDVSTLVAFLSEIFSLEPGDIVATGTPGGWRSSARRRPSWRSATSAPSR